MTELRFTRKAVEDLSDIWRYTVERWAEEQAARYYGLLVATCRKIAASTVPIGRRYEQIAEGLYGFRVGRHILFYRIESDRIILIVRILHERMDLGNRFAE